MYTITERNGQVDLTDAGTCRTFSVLEMDPHRARLLHQPYVYAALAIALTAGFGYAAILVAAPLLSVSGGIWWPSLVQAHGHAQLFGWAGLFVAGVGLIFLPRLRGTVLARPDLAPAALAALVFGIGLRSVSQPFLGALQSSSSAGDAVLTGLADSILATSGVAELTGIVLIAFMMASTFSKARPLSSGSPFLPVRPFLVIAASSMAVAAILNVGLTLQAALDSSSLVDPLLDQVLIQLLIMGFLLPLTFALAVRNLPLFMRLALPSSERFVPIMVIYVLGLVLRTAGMLLEQTFGSAILGIGSIIESAAILAFIWDLDVLLRRKSPWTATRIKPPPGYVETRKPTRPGYPDYGEYGRFELLVISAFLWLVLAASIAGVNGVLILSGAAPISSQDAERHALTVGFISLLIFGMAPRMLPGFSGKTRVASPNLVMATFWLGNLAALLRVLPLLFPDLPGGAFGYGLSGSIGWLAVACLALNLWRTFHLEQKR